jgi:hypothetical protein
MTQKSTTKRGLKKDFPPAFWPLCLFSSINLNIILNDISPFFKYKITPADKKYQKIASVSIYSVRLLALLY